MSVLFEDYQAFILLIFKNGKRHPSRSRWKVHSSAHCLVHEKRTFWI